MKYSFKPTGVCSSEITFDIEDGIVKNINFTGGCNGNLKALARAVEGKSADEIHELFNGIQCGYKSTSCSDQLAKAVMEAAEAE